MSPNLTFIEIFLERRKAEGLKLFITFKTFNSFKTFEDSKTFKTLKTFMSACNGELETIKSFKTF